MEEMFTMQPRFSESMWGSTAWMVFLAPVRFTASVRSQVASSVS